MCRSKIVNTVQLQVEQIDILSCVIGVEDGKRGQECDVSIAREWVTTREIVGHKGKKRVTGETSFKHVVKKGSHVE